MAIINIDWEAPREKKRTAVVTKPDEVSPPKRERLLPIAPPLKPQDAIRAEEPQTEGVEQNNPPLTEAAPDSPAEQNDSPAPAQTPGRASEFKNRLDTAQSRIQSQPANNDELEELLDQAVTLLDSLSQHPALRDYSANKRKLDEIEQRLGSGSYPQ